MKELKNNKLYLLLRIKTVKFVSQFGLTKRIETY